VPRSDDPGWHGSDHGPRPKPCARWLLSSALDRRSIGHSQASCTVLRDGERIFLMRRTRAGGDARLHDRFSIGVGGHLNPGDGDLLAGLRREWREELEAEFMPDFRLVGLLNDDTTEVGSVHLGAVYLADAAGRPVAIRETDKLSGAFATRDEVAAVVERMETWSRLVFEFLESAPIEVAAI
jgi:predicted NUDIX family phosphoesterase